MFETAEKESCQISITAFKSISFID